MKNVTGLTLVAATAALAGTAAEAGAQLVQVNRIFLDDSFNDVSDYGENPVGVAFDGTTAYVSGFNNSGADGTVGVVAVTDLYGTFGTATTTGLSGTVTSVPSGRAIESVAYDAATDSILTGTATGGATGVISRYDTSGNLVWSTANPSGVRPFAVGADPIAPGDDPSLAAFLTSSSGRRLGLDIDDGSLVYSTGSPSPGGAIIFNGEVNAAYRGMDFDAEGNLAYATANGFAYATRAGVNDFGGTSSTILANVGANNIGRDITILEGLADDGSDLFALAARDSTGLSDGDTAVYITDIDGNILDVLTGDESGLATAYANDTKALDFALAPDGTPTLVVTDFVERRLDVYQMVIPEPASLSLLGLGGLVLLRRRK